jgi:hypothetical protein
MIFRESQRGQRFVADRVVTGIAGSVIRFHSAADLSPAVEI